MPTLRLIAWNCHHGSVAARFEELASCAPAVVFLQECSPVVETQNLPLPCVTRRVNVRKAIALGVLGTGYAVHRLRARPNRGQAVVAAAVSGLASFTAIGIWSRGPRYADDVMRTLEAYERVLRSVRPWSWAI